MLVALDIHHRGKPGHWRDRGAVVNGVEEVDLTHRYAIAADRELRKLGWDCAILSDGTYQDRWARADAYGAAVYVACHVNAGGGDRGEVYFDARSARGPALATAVVGALRQFAPWPVSGKATEPGERPYNTISGVRAVALCYEPGYLDSLNLDHRRWLVVHVEEYGVALARGIDAWIKDGDPGSEKQA